MINKGHILSVVEHKQFATMDEADEMAKRIEADDADGWCYVAETWEGTIVIAAYNPDGEFEGVL